MIKLIAITVAAVALTACSSMSHRGSGTMGSSAGNPKETQNSTDANRSGNPAAVSPGGGAGAGTGAGAGAGTGGGGPGR
jgi:hypothetical protein